jgi:microcystin-dependent protein
MAAIDFPASPTVGQQFTAANGVTYQWTGIMWIVAPGTAGDFLPRDGSLPMTGDLVVGAGSDTVTVYADIGWISMSGNSAVDGAEAGWDVWNSAAPANEHGFTGLMSADGSFKIAAFTDAAVFTQIWQFKRDGTFVIPPPSNALTGNEAVTAAWVLAKGYAPATGGAYLPLIGGTLAGPGNLYVTGTFTAHGLSYFDNNIDARNPSDTWTQLRLINDAPTTGYATLLSLWRQAAGGGPAAAGALIGRLVFNGIGGDSAYAEFGGIGVNLVGANPAGGGNSIMYFNLNAGDGAGSPQRARLESTGDFYAYRRLIALGDNSQFYSSIEVKSPTGGYIDIGTDASDFIMRLQSNATDSYIATSVGSLYLNPASLYAFVTGSLVASTEVIAPYIRAQRTEWPGFLWEIQSNPVGAKRWDFIGWPGAGGELTLRWLDDASGELGRFQFNRDGMFTTMGTVYSRPDTAYESAFASDLVTVGGATFDWKYNGVNVWTFGIDPKSGGSMGGGNFIMNMFDDAGAYLATPILFTRNSKDAWFNFTTVRLGAAGYDPVNVLSMLGSMANTKHTASSTSDLMQSYIFGSDANGWGLRIFQRHTGSTIAYDYKVRNGSTTDITAITIASHGEVFFPVGIGSPTINGKLTVNAPPLGVSAGSVQEVAQFGSATANVDRLIARYDRLADGGDWTTSLVRFGRTVDSSVHGFMFWDVDGVGIGFPTGSQRQIEVLNDGRILLNGSTVSTGGEFSSPQGFVGVYHSMLAGGGMANQGGADGYTYLTDGSNHIALYLGGTASPSNVLRNNVHVLQDRVGTVTYATFIPGRMDVGNNAWVAGAILSEGWSYFTSNVASSNPSGSWSQGLAIGWNYAAGPAEINFVERFGGTFKFQHWNGTVMTPQTIEAAGFSGAHNYYMGTFHVPNVKFAIWDSKGFVVSPTADDDINGMGVGIAGVTLNTSVQSSARLFMTGANAAHAGALDLNSGSVVGSFIRMRNTAGVVSTYISADGDSLLAGSFISQYNLGKDLGSTTAYWRDAFIGYAHLSGYATAPLFQAQAASVPNFKWNATGNAAGLKLWEYFLYTDGDLYLRALDDGGTMVKQFQFKRSGDLIVPGDITATNLWANSTINSQSTITSNTHATDAPNYQTVVDATHWGFSRYWQGAAVRWDVGHNNNGDWFMSRYNPPGTSLGVAFGISATTGAATIVGGLYTGGLVLSSGLAWQPGSIYTDGNWGMIFRSAAATPTTHFAWFDYAGAQLLTYTTTNLLQVAANPPLAQNDTSVATTKWVKDQGYAGGGASGYVWMVKMTADQTVPVTTLTKINFDSISLERNGTNYSTANKRVTFPDAGLYFVSCRGSYNVNGQACNVYMHLYKNGVEITPTGQFRSVIAAGWFNTMEYDTLVDVVAGDYLEMWTHIDSPSGMILGSATMRWEGFRIDGVMGPQGPAGAGGALPVGSVIDFAGPAANIPSGYAECNGAAVSRTTFASLFTAIGTTWGVGDGSTTFNLPDLSSRMTIGRDNGTNRVTLAGSGVDATVPGKVGGSQFMQSHAHASHMGNAQGTSPDALSSTGNVGTVMTIQPTGAGTFQNMPPVGVVIKIIRTT